MPDLEIYTNVFLKIEKEEIEKFQYKINNRKNKNLIKSSFCDIIAKNIRYIR